MEYGVKQIRSLEISQVDSSYFAETEQFHSCTPLPSSSLCLICFVLELIPEKDLGEVHWFR